MQKLPTVTAHIAVVIAALYHILQYLHADLFAHVLPVEFFFWAYFVTDLPYTYTAFDKYSNLYFIKAFI